MRKFKVENVHCSNCANTIKNALEDDFGVIEVDLSVEPRVISLEISDEKVANFKSEMSDLGFDVIEEI
ncbi:heavy-metal-associated domain-containing protein [Campylobacter sp. RM9344]|uniref:Heavy-metal-associated domain-containing protein n=1 Tax=Campylobacter californiensis TaxID=1032243 RepID=A0AAW3ZSF3_9BACT|nr:MULTISPECIES: heavy-metal-associated domain-containing protein [unclassified Campylobacter]MBE2984704.1 heavy-metal-associated domain-containing protein [Campylobacter sp. RM6883]MBE2986467.1 heavy-metal-associated domain-containing protein [Campylobacter sp. RM12919]MBE2987818.1 heavy-metal-associated domain-containing protein [Campylobacter sp. RM12920]MBE2994620.1 heavy-metal-associated domain-containing protein [Campylobacter sp. RM6913]MBE3029146.1 heavy-metal-associated domain-contain